MLGNYKIPKNMTKRNPIPQQQSGASTDTVEKITLPTIEEAREHFELVKNRLLDITQWHELAGMASAKFLLTDQEGTPINRTARPGDYFQISIPGPGSEAGEGHDWAQIEAIEQEQEDGEEWLAIRVRPAANPTNEKSEAAHFFTSEASSTFMATRRGLTVSAEVHGRNEKSNNEETTLADTVRNTVMALGAMLGFSKLQWKSLVKGLLAKDY